MLNVNRFVRLTLFGHVGESSSMMTTTLWIYWENTRNRMCVTTMKMRQAKITTHFHARRCKWWCPRHAHTLARTQSQRNRIQHHWQCRRRWKWLWLMVWPYRAHRHDIELDIFSPLLCSLRFLRVSFIAVTSISHTQMRNFQSMTFIFSSFSMQSDPNFTILKWANEEKDDATKLSVWNTRVDSNENGTGADTSINDLNDGRR